MVVAMAAVRVAVEWVAAVVGGGRRRARLA